MRVRHWSILVGLVSVALLISGALSPPPAGSRAGAARTASKSAGGPASSAPGAARGLDNPGFARAVALFDEQRYAEALPLFDEQLGSSGAADARPAQFYRHSCALRLACVRQDEDSARRARTALLSLAQESADDWSARAVCELIRANTEASSELQRLLAQTLDHWERNPDVATATGHYLDLAEALLLPAGNYRPYAWQGINTVGAPLERMWQNLYDIRAPRDRLLPLAERILSDQYAWRFGEGRLRAARDVLTLDPPADLAALAHLRLGQDAEGRGQYRAAEAHYRAAIAAADPASDPSAGTAQAQLAALTQPAVGVQGAELYRPGSAHQLQVSWRNLSGWTLTIRRLDPVGDLVLPKSVDAYPSALAQWYRPDAGKTVTTRSFGDQDEQRARAIGAQPQARGATHGAGASGSTASAQPDTELFGPPVPEPHVPRTKLLTLDPLPAGLYLVQAESTPAESGTAQENAAPGSGGRGKRSASSRGNGKMPPWQPQSVQQIAFQVTDLGLVQQAVSGNQLELWLLEMADGVPQRGAELVVQRGRAEGSQHSLRWTSTRVRTGADGLARVAEWSGWTDHVMIAGAVNGRPVLMRSASPAWPAGDLEEHWNAYILTDRPLYRPGETVHLQAFLRRPDPSQRTNTVPRGERVIVSIRAADGSEAMRRELTLDDNGALELSHELEARPPLGNYFISLERPQPDGVPRGVATGSFQVDEYRLPEFTVSAALDETRRYVLGDTLKVIVTAEYLFGGPVAGEAEVVVTRTPRWILWHPWSRFAWLHEESGYAGDARGVGRMAKQWAGYGGEEVLRVSQPLAPDGTLTVSVPTPLDESQDQDYTYAVEARVTDASRREERASVSVPITRQEVYAFLSPERYLVAPGDEARVRLRLQDALDRPIAQRGKWSLWRQEPVKPPKGRSRAAGTAEPMAPLSEPVQLFSRVVATDLAGEALLTFRPERAAYYELRYETRDARGHPVTAQAVVWCADPDTRAIVHGAGALQLIAERDEFVDEGVARVLLVSDTAGAWVYLCQSFGVSVQTQVLHMSGTAQLLEIPLDDLHRPYFYLQASTAREFRLQQAVARIVAPLGQRALDVAVTFDQPSYKPGASAQLRVVTRGRLGTPVAAPVTVAVVDDAVLAILPRSLGDPNELFNSFPVRAPGDLLVSANEFGGFRWIEQPTAEERAEQDRRRGERGATNMVTSGYALGGVEGDEFRQSMAKEEGMGGRGDRDGASNVAARQAGKMAAFAMPAPAAAAPQAEAEAKGGGRLAPAALRTDFRTTALWRTAVWTDQDGTASVDVPLAESLTRWTALAVAITPSTQAGMGEGATRTRKDVMVRVNHPRVFRELDRFLFAATVHNETEHDLLARVSMSADPLVIEGGEQQVNVPAHGQAPVQWWAHVAASSAQSQVVRDSVTARLRVVPGEARVRVTALTSVESDALERPVKLLPHGTDLRVVAAGEVRPGSTQLTFKLPAQRQSGTQVAAVTLSPSVLSTCIDALGYLADYPYGCTEQTLSRFAPAAAVRAVLTALKVRSARVDPELDAKIKAGLRRIADFQHEDGGWGWWQEGESDPYMTAHVLVALSHAARHGVGVDSGMLQHGRAALRALLAKGPLHEDHRAYALYALAAADPAIALSDPGPGGHPQAQEDDGMRALATRLFKDRDQLSDYARALLATYMARTGHADQGTLLLRHLENTVERDAAYGTAHWGKLRDYWWCGQGAVESTAFAVEAYGALEPNHELRRAAVRWLVVNRQGTRWQSTRATAHAIYALTDFARDTGELEARYTLVVRAGAAGGSGTGSAAGGTEVARITVTPQTLIDAGGSFPLPAHLLRDGTNALQLSLEGKGTCVATVSVDGWTAAENPAPTEHVLGVRREVVRLRPQRTLGGSILQIEEPLRDGERVESGERVRVRLWLSAHNDLEYIAIEDPRPAGCEPTDQLSGWFQSDGVVPLPLARATGGAAAFGASQTPASPVSGRREVRDELTAFFVASLGQGEHVLSYELRAESPGSYHVLPARAWAMYVPDVNGSSAEDRLEIVAPSQPQASR